MRGCDVLCIASMLRRWVVTWSVQIASNIAIDMVSRSPPQPLMEEQDGTTAKDLTTEAKGNGLGGSLFRSRTPREMLNMKGDSDKGAGGDEVSTGMAKLPPKPAQFVPSSPAVKMPVVQTS